MPWSKRPATHRCLAHDCAEQISNKKLFCLTHWNATPRALRDEICEAWKYGLAYQCHPTPEYIRVVGAAQRLLREKTARANAASPIFAGGAI